MKTLWFLTKALILMGLSQAALRTNAGRDWQARVMGDTSSNGTGSYAAANYMGLTADNTAPASSDTTLTGEISSGTLTRAQGTYAHTNGTGTYTVSKTFTSDQTVTVRKAALFNASSSGTMAFSSLLDADASMVSGDTVLITLTVTL